MRKMHFISGLPRSGSTLLSALLNQNSNFCASMSSALANIVGQVISTLGGHSEYGILVSDTKRKAVVRGLFQNFYEELPKEKIIFDTNRAWCSRMPVLEEIFDDYRVIACVRHPAEIVSSFERIFRRHPLKASKLIPKDASANMYTRVDHMMSRSGVIGFALNSLQEAIHGDQKSKLIIVRYDSLVNNSAETMRHLYNSIGENFFQHDFHNIRFDDGEKFDEQIGLPGLHRVARSMQSKHFGASLLPPEITRRFPDTRFWESELLQGGEIDLI